jgi:diguanylate cyclase (GGDEF)-like protein
MTMENLSDLFKNLAEPSIFSVATLIIFIIFIVTTYIITKNFIEKRRESYRKIKMMTNIDELTYLYKRKFFDTLFESELERAKRHDRNLSCAIIEIDNINKIKDKYGDQACDLVVQDIGEIFTDDTRVHDICARFSKFSFVSLMPESDLDSALLAIKRLRGLIERSKIEIEGTNEILRITVSIGLISCKEYFEEEVDTTKLLDMANKALDIAKENGGNRVECYLDINS